jgi:hypothetical protein
VQNTQRGCKMSSKKTTLSPPKDDTMSTKTEPRTKRDTSEYMRRYRAEGRDKATRVQTVTRNKALNWVRSNHPDVWNKLLTEAKNEVSKQGT